MNEKTNAEPIGPGERIYLHIYDYETKEFSGLTTFHGLVRIYSSNTWPSRIFWCVVVLSCLSLFMIHSGYLLLGYHSKPTLFQVNTIVAVDGILFPDITICNQNRVKTSRLLKYSMSRQLVSYIFKSMDDHLESDGDDSDHRLFAQFMEDHKKRTGKNFSLIEFFNDIRPSCKDMLLSCSFAGQHEDCCLVSDVVITDLGFCIRLSNSKLKKRQFFSGSSYGWHFVLDGNNELDYSFNTDLGFRVAIHELGKEISMQSRGLAVPPGATLHAGLFLKNISLLQKTAWGFCLDDWNALNHGAVLTNLTYTATHCEWNCLAREWLSTCGCVLMKHHVLNISANASVCQPYDIQRCSGKIIENTTACNCDVECRLMEYDVHMSYSDVFLSSLQQVLSFSEHYVKNNVSVMNIFMGSIAYERHEQQKQLQTGDLLASIAGSMGLFLGMSTITLLEIFIYLFKSVWGTVNTDRQKQFMNAMMEEENERRQSVVIVEEIPQEVPVTDEDPKSGKSPRLTRRISVVPLHICSDRRKSVATRRLQFRTCSSMSFNKTISARKSLTSGRSVFRRSNLDLAVGAPLSSSPLHRRSIAFGHIGRDFSIEGAGELLPPRRASAAVTHQSQKVGRNYNTLKDCSDKENTETADICQSQPILLAILTSNRTTTPFITQQMVEDYHLRIQSIFFCKNLNVLSPSRRK
ncbi:hypothetical protein KIN20_023689 [Parelaphostrongylus tenuis]|uniref:Amiloride-sensitive sodium channel n=1 Tax=Parelaphostrongylus tenuis TaxID=148309 RepID=A0AAD5MVZ8_PARTN|nr:hypothetical protein KIN20_023689 [Parelaphostrongylus tenuis]